MPKVNFPLQRMEVGEPIWNSTYRYYTFAITVADPSGVSVELEGSAEPTAADLSGLVNTFIQGSAAHFATPIGYDVFMNRVEHVFVGKDSIEGATNTMLVRWVPTSIRVYTTRFEIYWGIVSVDRNTIIPSGFLTAISEPEPIRTITIQQSESSPAGDDLGMELLEASSEMEGGAPPEEAPAERNAYKRRVREARLRVAAARLRAERLAESYFQKYGAISLEEDSLSSDSDSDSLYPKNIGSH